MSLIRRTLTLWTDHIYAMPALILFPHSRCNCRCVMCDIWKGNAALSELSEADMRGLLDDVRRLRVQWVAFSGGEALMHRDLFDLCRLFRQEGARVTLLSTGLLLRKNADRIVADCSDVIVSLDGSPAVHDRIRNIPDAFARLAEGVQAIKSLRPGFRVTGRCVLQKLNFADLPHIIRTAHDIGLDQISFLGADVSSEAFNRPVPWDDDRIRMVALNEADMEAFREEVERVIHAHAADFASGFIAESPDKLRRIVAYYEAVAGQGAFPPVVCNAPWVSAVIEADGTVRPCFFHRPIGNIHDKSLEAIVNGAEAVRFRKTLDMATDPTCRRCVCSVNLRPATAI